MDGAMPSGMQARPQHVERRRQQFLSDLRGEQRDAGVGVDQVPVAIDHHGRVGLVAGQHLAQRLSDRRHPRRVDRGLRKHGRVAGVQQQQVALAQRHVELLGQAQHHVAAGRRATRLDEAQVAGRDLGLERELELAQSAVFAPLPQQFAHRALQRFCARRRECRHTVDRTPLAAGAAITWDVIDAPRLCWHRDFAFIPISRSHLQ